jgi:hypothetical protein
VAAPIVFFAGSAITAPAFTRMVFRNAGGSHHGWNIAARDGFSSSFVG